MTDATANVVQHTDGIGQWKRTNPTQHIQRTPALSKYNHAPRLANHNRRAWLSSHDTPAASAPSGRRSNQFRKTKIRIKSDIRNWLQSSFRYRHVSYIKSHGDMPRKYVQTCTSVLPELDFASMVNWFPTFRHKWPRNFGNELAS